jgi:hypothetical protein
MKLINLKQTKHQKNSISGFLRAPLVPTRSRHTNKQNAKEKKERKPRSVFFLAQV